MGDPVPASLVSSFRRWFEEHSTQEGGIPAVRRFVALLYEFLRDSLPSRRCQRYGDVDYDWVYRVDTTSATVGWRDRLLGLLHSPYQPTDPALFREMLDRLPIDFREFVFLDIGSGKGRVLLMAADYPFRRVIGVELLPELHRIAQENVSKYKSESQKCLAIETICGDAREFAFPLEPLVVYLFNPLPEAGLKQLLHNLQASLKRSPTTVYLLYHNPLLEHVLIECSWLKKVGGTHQYSLFAIQTRPSRD